MTATATRPHADRLSRPEKVSVAPYGDVELAVERLVSLMAGSYPDEVTALEAVARTAGRLAGRRRRGPLDEDRPVAIAGAWSLDNGMLPNIVLGED